MTSERSTTGTVTSRDVAERARERRAGMAELRAAADDALAEALDAVDRAAHSYPHFDARGLTQYEFAHQFAQEILGLEWVEEHMGDPGHRARRYLFAVERARDFAAREFSRIPQGVREVTVEAAMARVEQWDLAGVAEQLVRLRCLSLASSLDRRPVWVPLEQFPDADDPGPADRVDPATESLYDVVAANAGGGFYIDEVLTRAADLRRQRDTEVVAAARSGAPRAYRTELAQVAQAVLESLQEGWWAVEAFLGDTVAEPTARPGTKAHGGQRERAQRERREQRNLVIWRSMLAAHPQRWAAYRGFVDRIPSRTDMVRAVDHQDIHVRRLPVVLAMVCESIAAAMEESGCELL